MKNEGRKKHVAVSATVNVLLRIMENKEWYCSNEELQEYIKTDGNRIIWSIIHTYARGLDQDDAYQEALIGVWKALAAYDPKRVDTKKSTFVYQTVYNQIKMMLRHNGTNKRSVERESSSTDEQVNLCNIFVSLEDEIIEQIEMESRASALWNAIEKAKLSKEERAVIIMTLEEIRQCDIGARLGASQGHVSKLKKSAMAKLKDYLENAGCNCEYSIYIV